METKLEQMIIEGLDYQREYDLKDDDENYATVVDQVKEEQEEFRKHDIETKGPFIFHLYYTDDADFIVHDLIVKEKKFE